jgi:hypothetical protein
VSARLPIPSLQIRQQSTTSRRNSKKHTAPWTPAWNLQLAATLASQNFEDEFHLFMRKDETTQVVAKMKMYGRLKLGKKTSDNVFSFGLQRRSSAAG